MLRIIHGLELLNKITIRHSGVPPIPEHLVEQFAGRSCGMMEPRGAWAWEVVVSQVMQGWKGHKVC